MNIKSTYLTPQSEEVFLENEGMMCQSGYDTKYSTSGFEWDEAMDL